MPQTDEGIALNERASGDGRQAMPRRFRSAPRRRMLSWVVLGTLGAVLFALAFASWAGSQDERVRVLALRVDVAAGERLEPDHITEARVAADGGGLVAADNAARLVGRTAMIDLPEGSLLSEALFAPSRRVGPGEAVVGVALDPADLPVPTLAPGEGLLLVRTPPPETAGLSDADASDMLAWWGEVFDVTAPPDAVAPGQRVTVSLRVAEAYAPAVATAAATGQLRLVLVTAPGPLAETPAPSGSLEELVDILEEAPASEGEESP